jgi:hypothetical protein
MMIFCANYEDNCEKVYDPDMIQTA